MLRCTHNTVEPYRPNFGSPPFISFNEVSPSLTLLQSRVSMVQTVQHTIAVHLRVPEAEEDVERQMSKRCEAQKSRILLGMVHLQQFSVTFHRHCFHDRGATFDRSRVRKRHLIQCSTDFFFQKNSRTNSRSGCMRSLDFKQKLSDQCKVRRGKL